MTMPYDGTGLASTNLVTPEVHSPITVPVIWPTAGCFYNQNLTVNGVSSTDGTTKTLTLFSDFTFSPEFISQSQATGLEVYSWVLLTNYTAWTSITLTYQAVGGDIQDSILLSQVANANMTLAQQQDINNWLNIPGDIAALSAQTMGQDLNSSGMAYMFATKLSALAQALSTPSTYLTFINSTFTTLQNTVTSVQTQVNALQASISSSGLLDGNWVSPDFVTNQINNALGVLQNYATKAQGLKADAIGGVTGLVKSNGHSVFAAAVANTDYTNPTGLTAAITALNLGTASHNNTGDFDAAGAATAAFNSAKSYADSIVSSSILDQGNWDASVGTFPVVGSGIAGAVMKGNYWFVSVIGTLGGTAVNVGDTIRAIVDTPGQTSTNWVITHTGISYTPENQTNKSNNVATDIASTVKYPSVAAIVAWVTTTLGSYVSGSALTTALSNYVTGPALTSLLNLFVPAGVIFQYGGTTVPTGFLRVPSSPTLVNVSDYPNLYANIGLAWGNGTNVPTAIAGHESVVINGNEIITFGGYDTDGSISNVFTTTLNNGWQTMSSQPIELFGQSVTVLPDGRLFMAGGNGFKQYSNSLKGDVTNFAYFGTISGNVITWISSTAPLPGNRRYHAITLLNDGRLLMTGGINGQTPEVADHSTWIGTVSGNTVSWVASTVMPVAVSNHTATLLDDVGTLNSRILLIGGSTNTALSGNYYIGTIVNGGNTISWSSGSIFPDTLMNHQAVIISDGRIVVTGGQNASGNVNTVYIGTMTGSIISWVSASQTLPNTISEHSCVVMDDGTIVITGGIVNGNLSSACLFGVISGNSIPWASKYNTTSPTTFWLPWVNIGDPLVAGDSSNIGSWTIGKVRQHRHKSQYGSNTPGTVDTIGAGTEIGNMGITYNYPTTFNGTSPSNKASGAFVGFIVKF